MNNTQVLLEFLEYGGEEIMENGHTISVRNALRELRIGLRVLDSEAFLEFLKLQNNNIKYFYHLEKLVFHKKLQQYYFFSFASFLFSFSILAIKSFSI
jgi:hypothetical protein